MAEARARLSVLQAHFGDGVGQSKVTACSSITQERCAAIGIEDMSGKLLRGQVMAGADSTTRVSTTARCSPTNEIPLCQSASSDEHRFPSPVLVFLPQPKLANSRL